MDLQTGRMGQFKDVVASLLFYLKYLRLMILCALLVFSGALVYYAYTKAVYQSRLLLRYTPLDIAIVGNDSAANLAARLESRHLTELACRRLGLTSSVGGSYEWIRENIVKKVAVTTIDGHTLALETYPYSAALLTTLPKAMLDVYFEDRAREAQALRNKQMESYEKQLDLLLTKLQDKQNKAFDFEQDNSITELFIRQQGLTQVPRQMIVARQKLESMDQIRQRLNSPGMDVVAKLSLLEEFRKDQIEVGNVLPVGPEMAIPGQAMNQKGRKGDDPAQTLESISGLAPSGQAENNIVVVPSMVEELLPWQKTERKLREVNEEIRLNEKTFLPGHATMKALIASKTQLEESLQIELQASLQRFELIYAGVQENLSDLEAKLPNYREVTQAYQRFRQEYQLKVGSDLSYQASYEEIAKELTRYQFGKESRVFLGSDYEPLEILGFTILRYDPVSPPKGKLVIISLFLAIGLASAVPFGLEKLNDRSHTLEVMENSLQLPGLGIIPAYTQAQLEDLSRSHEKDSDEPDLLMENFRNLRGNISMNRDMTIPSQAIMISSARPKEGKTTVALNLAWAFASMGDKTLLIDCDLRRGRLHRSMNSSSSPGMTEVLTRDISWESAIHETGQSDLHFIPRGPIIPGSTEVLCHPKFIEIMKEMRGKYDRIILDTPPVLGLSETTSIQRAVDGMLLVIMAESTPRRDIIMAVDQLKKAGGRFYGFVLNRLDLSKIQNFYHYSYYSPNYYAALEEKVSKS